MNMIRFGAMACALIVVCSSTSELMAQRGGWTFARMMGSAKLDSTLLAIKEVQEELSLTDEQMESVAAPAEALAEEMRTEMRDIFMGGGERSEIDALMEEMLEAEQEFVTHLTDEQKQRLNELHCQRMDTGMFADEGVQKALELSEEQAQSINEAFSTFDEIVAEARQSGDFSMMREIMEDAGKEAEDAIMAVLSDEQKQKAEDMKGEAFEFPQRQRRQPKSDF
ncbi:MAG: hypothetical protein ACR2NP_02170 [Pirellulaceae bacterium]